MYMSGMKVNFHRNFVQVYPFISLLFAVGIYVLYHVLGIIQKRMLPGKEWLPTISIILITFAFLLPQAYLSLNDAKIIYEAKDTRTKAIDEINALKDVRKLVIAKELMIHAQDLKHLEKPYTVEPVLKIFLRAVDENSLLVLPSNPKSWLKNPKFKKKAEQMRMIISRFENSSIVKKIGNNGATMIDIYSVNPGIILVRDVQR